MSCILRRLVLVSALIAAMVLVATPAGAASPPDKKLAAQGAIVADDLPASWQSTPADDSSDKKLEKSAKKIAACKDYLAVRKTLDQAPSAKSRDFATGGESLSNEVWVFTSASKAKKAFAQMSDDSVEDCLTTLFQDQFESLIAGDATVDGVQARIVQTTELPNVGDDIVGYVGGAEVTLADGTVQRLPLSNAVVRVGRSILSYTFSGGPTATGAYTQPFLSGVDSALGATVNRMRDALS